MDAEKYRYGRRVTLIGIIVNVFVSAMELVVGILGRSSALIADAIHSLSDVGATSIVYIGLKYSSIPKDKNHPYGHGKIESLTALFLGMILILTGAYLIYKNTSKIHYGNYLTPEWFTLGAALLTIVIKEWMYRYTIRAGKRLNSPSISANAYHHRSDAYTSLGVFFGILGAYVGFPILDPVAALIVAVFIILIAFNIIKEAFLDLSDITIPDQLRTNIEKVVEDWNPEYHVVEVIGRRMGTRYQVNMKIRIGPYIQAIDGISDFKELEKRIQRKIPSIQGVDISGDVDTKKVKIREKQFKDSVQATLDNYAGRYHTIENVEFHFLPDQQEVHFDMIVDPEISVGDAHEITRLIERDICKEFSEAQVIIHIEPVDTGK